jgi:NAD(P)H dehydrogenase (quinone)
VLHLRCGSFMTNLLVSATEVACGTLSTPWPPAHPLPWVDPRDIGDVAAVRLLGSGWAGRRVQGVHGPEDLGFAQVAEVLTGGA